MAILGISVSPGVQAWHPSDPDLDVCGVVLWGYTGVGVLVCEGSDVLVCGGFLVLGKA